MAISTWDDVIAALRKCQLLEPDQLELAMGATRNLSDPSTIARKLVTANLLTRWQAAELISGRIPLRMGKYRLFNQSGFTDLGPVYAAENIETANRVELKTISQSFDSSSPEFKLFISEARSIASIIHPNILRVGEIILEGGTAYLVTEDHGGRDLQRVVEKQHPISAVLAANYIRQAADGMAEVHSRGLVHRELRPDNVFIDEEGTIKIGGLGLACLTQTPPQKATTADAVNYLSPEQAGGDEVGPASDVYALGCIFHFLLTGRPPFPDGSAEQRLQQRLDETPSSVTELRSDVPVAIAEVCETMLARSVESRYADANEIVEALAPWQMTTPETDDATTSVIPLGIGDSDERASTVATASPVARAAPKRARPATDRESEPTGLDFSSPAVATENETETSPYTRTGRRKNSQALIAIVAMVGLLVAGGAAIYAFLPDDKGTVASRPLKAPESNVDPEPQTTRRAVQPKNQIDAPPPIVAKFTDLVDCQWTDGKKFDVQQALHEGERIKLSAGRVEITFTCGAKVQLEGPAEFEIQSAFEAVVHNGNPVLHIPDGLEGFAVRDSKGKIVTATSKPNAPPATDGGDNVAVEDPKTNPPKDIKPPPEPAPVPNPPEPVPAKPFTLDQLAKAVSLPSPESENIEPVVLGPLPGALPEDFAISLRSNAAEPSRMNRRFAVERVEPKPAQPNAPKGRHWRIALASGEAAAAGNATPIARLTLHQEKLQLRWTKIAPAEPDAIYLQNCLIGIAGGGKEHLVALRQPTEFAVPKLSFPPKPNSYIVPIVAMPDSQYIRVQLVGLRGLQDEKTPQQFRDSRSLLDKPHDETTIEFGEGDSRLLVGIKSRVIALKKQPHIKIDLASAVAWDAKRPPLTYADFVGRFKKNEAAFTAQEKTLKKLEQAKQLAQDKGRFNRPIDVVKAKIELMKPVMAKIRASRAVIERVGQNTRLHFRVYYEVDGHQVDLVRSVASKESAEEEPKPKPDDQ
jgi:serine/threonine protein kinase